MRVAVGGELERLLRERRGVERVDDGTDRLGVDEFIGRQRPHLRQRDAADDIGQVSRRGRRGDQLGELVLGHRDDFHLDTRFLDESVDDGLGGGDAVGEVLLHPEGDAVSAAVAFAPAA
jgi:hypothetical protein